jgi:hypothetical protein
MAVTTTTQIDPTIQPFLSYGLSEAQRLYQTGGPQYYPGQTYVGPSETTQTGLQALEQRARMGNPLLGAAQQQIQGTIGGQYLGGNPFFQGAFAPAAQAATTQFKTAIGDIGSAASKAGRYGSGAMGALEDRASNQLAQQLSNTAGQLAYQNYANERARQQAATMAAPALSQADYQDIQNLLAAGQAREGYTGQQTAADIARFNFQQNAPQQNLSTFLSSVYGNPMANLRSQSPSGYADTSTLQNVLGTTATFGGLYKNLGGSTGISNITNSIGNWLNPYGGTPQGAYSQQTQYLNSALSNPQTQQAQMLSDQNSWFSGGVGPNGAFASPDVGYVNNVYSSNPLMATPLIAPNNIAIEYNRPGF